MEHTLTPEQLSSNPVVAQIESTIKIEATLEIGTEFVINQVV